MASPSHGRAGNFVDVRPEKLNEQLFAGDTIHPDHEPSGFARDLRPDDVARDLRRAGFARELRLEGERGGGQCAMGRLGSVRPPTALR